jgi:hypothetical protein
MQVITNAVGLFAEMVGSIKDEEPRAVRDPVMVDLAEQCTYFKRWVEYYATTNCIKI